MSNKYKTTFFFFLLLIYGSSYSQSNNDTIKFEMKNKDVLIVNKQATDEWDFDSEQDNDKKILSVELFYGTTGYGEFEDNTFFLVDKQENSATNFFNSYHWGANLLINLCESKNERFYLSTGLGYSVTKYSFVNNMQLQAENGTTTFNLDSADLKSSKLKPRKGTVLHVMSAGGVNSKAKLSVSPERRTGFISADILDGDPSLGDWVFFKLKENQIDETYSEEPGKNEDNVEAAPLNLEQPSGD